MTLPHSPLVTLATSAFAIVTDIEATKGWRRRLLVLLLGRRFLRDVVQMRRHLYLLWAMVDRERNAG